MIKELSDDVARAKKDTEINQTKYMKIDVNAGLIAPAPASSFGVGDMILLQPNERAPADLVLIYTKDKTG